MYSAYQSQASKLRKEKNNVSFILILYLNTASAIVYGYDIDIYMDLE